MNTLRIGTRGSPLALWQARHVSELLRPHQVDLVLIETEGDRVRDRALSQIGGEGLFTKEVQNALLDGRADIAVHSLKDLPTNPSPGLVLGAVPARGPIGDVLVSRRHPRFEALPLGAVVGTSSLRRRAQLLNRRPDLKVVNLRGNVETRLRKLEDEGLDAIVLAEAGLVRLELAGHITEVLDREWMLPAVGQGALGLECREGDAQTALALTPLNDPATRAAVLAERACLRGLGGGCLVPIGALGVVEGDILTLRASVLPADGTSCMNDSMAGPADRAEELGEALARRLLEGGAGELLCRR